MEAQVMWEPDSKRNTHMDQFRAAVAAAYGIHLGEPEAGERREKEGCCGRRGPAWFIQAARLRPAAGKVRRYTAGEDAMLSSNGLGRWRCRGRWVGGGGAGMKSPLPSLKEW